MKKILIVGGGGIGSWIAPDIDHYNKHNQFHKTLFYFADEDTVESKNLPYTTYETEDIMDNKAECLEVKYGFSAITENILTEEQLTGYDCIVSAVDNTAFRELLFRFAEKNPEVYWIDLRSEGRSIAAFTKHPTNTLDDMLKTLPEKVENGSCQLAYELEAGIVQG